MSSTLSYTVNTTEAPASTAASATHRCLSKAEFYRQKLHNNIYFKKSPSLRKEEKKKIFERRRMYKNYLRNIESNQTIDIKQAIIDSLEGFDYYIDKMNYYIYMYKILNAERCKAINSTGKNKGERCKRSSEEYDDNCWQH